MPRRSLPLSQIAIDASALVELLLRTPTGERISELVADATLVAPDLINPEVIQSLRGLVRGRLLSGERATQAISRLAEGPIVRVSTTGLIREAWTLRANLSAYDACYVALARTLGCPLVTIDGPLRRAPALGVALLSVG